MTDLSGAYDADAAPGGDFDPIPQADYVMRIVSAERRAVSETKNCGDHLNLTWQVEGGDFDGRLVWQTINLWWERAHPSYDKVIKIANAQFAAIREATGVHMPKNTDELLERPCLVRVRIEKGKDGYPDRNAIGSVKPVSGNAPPRPSSPTPGAGKTNLFTKAKAASPS